MNAKYGLSASGEENNMARDHVNSFAACSVALGVVLAATLSASGAELPTGEAGQIPAFGDFIASVRSAGHQQLAAGAESKVAGEAAFDEMKAHILRSYEHVDPRQVRHSFADDN